ncbi:COX15/CtaA family protein [Pedobacter zeae]|uniref:Cytochrome c oxidase assembly protein subunit 15 n=1 Tax=Pedobacter zeae TaxID=1737356 RepID=A0A7W6KE48_9SPHI|nr:COX15/CtaA family protein [Pedobacter zeae]MBB4110143.1 cytochrome c oxidase assembly protein subunit 15 [Pedobacter zeae]GGH16285.1 cytochrome oxidase assembly protein [Pedobacter zeae]
MVSRSEQRFISINLITIIVTLLVILAGGIVRSTGSGMGCPDWPKCFDRYIPPTDVSQLPANYKEKYVAGRLKKNEKFAKYLESMGKVALADSIRHDKSITIPEEFNPAKTWTEYINRLVGVAAGIFLFLTMVYSFTFRKKAKRIIVLSILNLFVVGYQGWLGSIVVSTNLTQWVVTVHMLLALVILAISIYTYNYAKQLNKAPSVIMYRILWLKGFLFFTLLISIIQIVLGTDVREAIDGVAKELAYGSKHTWLSKAGSVFSYHRDLAILVVVTNAIVYKMVIDRFSGKAAPLLTARFILITLLVQLLSGFALAYIAFPPAAQAVHILFSTLLFSLQFYLYLLVYRTSTYKQ